MVVFEEILPLPVMALVCVGMVSLIVLMMSKSKKAEKQLKSKFKTSKPDEKPIFRGNLTKEEVSRHNTSEDAWIIVDGKVYDITTYVDLHPGGRAYLMTISYI
jgi:cytochrome b involved in lipid metabolism